MSVVFTGCGAHSFPYGIFVYKGIVWLLLATVAELPPTVRLGILLASLIFAHGYFVPQVFIFLNLNGIFSFSPACDEY